MANSSNCANRYGVPGGNGQDGKKALAVFDSSDCLRTVFGPSVVVLGNSGLLPFRVVRSPKTEPEGKEHSGLVSPESLTDIVVPPRLRGSGFDYFTRRDE